MKLLYLDWLRAPVSGTLVILSAVAAMAFLVRGDWDHALLFWIWNGVLSNGRGSMS